MAKYGKSLAQVVVEINGKQQVQQVLKAMEESAEKLRAKIDQTKAELEELAKGGTSPEYTKKLGDLKQLETEEKQIKRALNETKKLNLDINDVLANMSEYSALPPRATSKRSYSSSLPNKSSSAFKIPTSIALVIFAFFVSISLASTLPFKIKSIFFISK